MKAKVIRVKHELVFDIDRKWTFHRIEGSSVKIAGLLPGNSPDERRSNEVSLSKLILNKEVEIVKFLFACSNTLHALVKFNGTYIQDYFPDRAIPIPDPSRWINPLDSHLFKKTSSAIPSSWVNPIGNLPSECKPFFGNIRYPVKPWEKDYEKQIKLALALYTDSYGNRELLTKWITDFLESHSREAAFVLQGDVGTGKSWFISHNIMCLPDKKYHKAIIDLRYLSRDDLSKAIHRELKEFLNYYIDDLSWLYPDFKPIYNNKFDPEDTNIQKHLINRAIELESNLDDLIQKKLRYYNQNDVELLIVFDNIDHFNEDEFATIIDLCRRSVGNCCGVKTIMVMRPTTLLTKGRTGISFGDQILKTIKLESPDVREVLSKRCLINKYGDEITGCVEDKGKDKTTLEEILHIYHESDYDWGTARLLMELCCTEKLTVFERNYANDIKKLSSSYDLRHYLRLFRTLLLSDKIGSFDNIGKIYYGIHALILSSDNTMVESTAYLFNLFDNGEPNKPGNALIRYRILEYCNLFNDLGDIFDIFFNALGYDSEATQKLLILFSDAGLINIDYKKSLQGLLIPNKAYLTVSGKRHFDLITNLWYIICIKTGMYVYKDLILHGDSAKEKISLFTKSTTKLDMYSHNGWVSEEDFIKFVGSQEILEHYRIGEYQKNNPDLREQISNMADNISSPAANLHYSYHEQIKRWNSHIGTRAYREVL